MKDVRAFEWGVARDETEARRAHDWRKPFMATADDRRWSNTYLHVELIGDPKMKLRSLRTFLAGEIVERRRVLNEARRERDQAIDNGEFRSWVAVHRAKVDAQKLALAQLRRMAKELRS